MTDNIAEPDKDVIQRDPDVYPSEITEDRVGLESDEDDEDDE